MKVYQGVRAESGCQVTVTKGRKVKPLEPCLWLENKSPTGFEWGYGGSGPHQLALAILYDAIGKKAELACLYMHDFCVEVVAGLDGATWTLTDEDVHSWICNRCVADLAERGQWRRKGT